MKCKANIMAMMTPKDSRVVVVWATSPVPLELKKKMSDTDLVY